MTTMENTDNHHTMRFNLLILGDGDFSFSLGLLKRLQSIQQTKPSYQILATSFDSQAEIHQKYPDSKVIISEFKKDPNTFILHDVDATQLEHSEPLREHYHPEHGFTDIIFNFPHLGKEDCISHSSLLAHIMYSAKFLMTQASYLTIALAESQGILWRINEMAELNGLHPVSTVQFNANDWPGYILRRHHTGKSFKGRVNQCLHYTYRLKPTEERTAVGSLQNDSIIRYLQLHAPQPHPQPQVPTVAAQSTVTKDSVSNISDNNVAFCDLRPKKKRSKMETLVDGHYRSINIPDNTNKGTFCEENESDDTGGAASTATASMIVAWQCDFCKKILNSEQGVKTHVYKEHFVNQPTTTTTTTTATAADARADSDVGVMATKSSQMDTTVTTGGSREKETFRCEHCDKVVSNSDALMQHMRSKHGIFSNIKPDWAMATKASDSVSGANGVSGKYEGVMGDNLPQQQSTEADTTGGDNLLATPENATFQCSVCGICFTDETSFTLHLSNGFIPENLTLTFTCDKCNRVFSNDRALKQHMNFCLVVGR